MKRNLNESQSEQRKSLVMIDCFTWKKLYLDCAKEMKYDCTYIFKNMSHSCGSHPPLHIS